MPCYSLVESTNNEVHGMRRRSPQSYPPAFFPTGLPPSGRENRVRLLPGFDS